MGNDVSDELHTYIKSLRRYAMALSRNPDEADDLVQECLKRALVYLKDGREIRDLRAYLFTILHNVHADEMTRRRKAGTQVPIEDTPGVLAYPAPQHDQLACRELPRALEQLPPEQREALVLVGLEEMTYRDAAGVLGVPVGTVMSRLSRGREALRRLMRGGDGEAATNSNGKRTAKASARAGRTQPAGRQDFPDLALRKSAKGR